MKIAIINSRVPLPFGNNINTLKNAQGFFSLGHEVVILNVIGFLEEIWRLKIKNFHDFFGVNSNIKVKYFRGSILFYLRRLKLIRAILKFIRIFPKIYDLLDPEIKVSNYCKKNKIDYVFCRDTYRTVYNNVINKIPTTIDIHNRIFPIGLKNLLKLKNSKYFKGITTVNDVIKQFFVGKGFPEEKVFSMENPVNLSEFNRITNKKNKLRKKLNLPLNKKIIMYCGNIKYDREIDIILIAAELLNDKEISFYFLGGTKKIIKKWVKYKEKNKIKSDINFLGMKVKRLIPYYLKAVDILLATYSSNCSTLEVMSPIKIFEYMGAKVPIIASKIGRNIDICNNGECLFTKPNDPKDLSEKIRLLLTDDALRKELIKNAYAKAKNQTLKKRSRKIIEFIK